MHAYRKVIVCVCVCVCLVDSLFFPILNLDCYFSLLNHMSLEMEGRFLGEFILLEWKNLRLKTYG